MKDHDLLEAVGGINEKYVNNAESNQKKKKHGYTIYYLLKNYLQKKFFYY